MLAIVKAMEESKPAVAMVVLWRLEWQWRQNSPMMDSSGLWAPQASFVAADKGARRPWIRDLPSLIFFEKIGVMSSLALTINTDELAIVF